MFLSRCKTTIKLFFCLFAFAFVIVSLRYFNASKLSHLSGERQFYLYSPSSQATIKSRLSPLDCFFVRGESVRLSVGEDGVEEIVDGLQAEVLFIERVDDIVSYYAYSKILGGGILVNGKKINLHIAVGKGRCTVGTPIIFGGF